MDETRDQESRSLADLSRSDLSVESSFLVRRAAWCGVVFALAIVLTSLNFWPPVVVRYHVRSEVVLSATRLAQLQQLAEADREAVRQGSLKRIQLLSVKVLDLADQEEPVINNGPMVLAEVGSLWLGRCTSERHYTWLKNISQVDPVRLADNRAASEARFARWELAAAQHYQAQHKYLATKELDTDVAGPVSFANQSKNRQAFQLASFGETVEPAQYQTPAQEPPASAAGEEQTLQLSSQVETAKQRVVATEAAWRAAIEDSSGALQIASLPSIDPRSTTIPLWMAASVLILGLATGASVGWMQIRQQSGGSSQPRQVAEQLALDSLPTVGRVQLPLDSDEQASSLDQLPQRVIYRVGGRLTRLSEWVVTFWAFLATGRFFLDGVWRDVLVESPLAALGRLLVGMP